MKATLQEVEDVRHQIEVLRGEATRAIDPDSIPCREISSPDQLCPEPLVSVAMITYNHARFIRAGIEGVVRQQTSFPFELVIGEDCSTDETRAIVLEYQQRYPQIIRVLVSDANVGATSNALRTLIRCRGKYLAHCEGDDYWCDPEKLALQAEVLERRPEVGLVYTDGIMKLHDGTMLDQRLRFLPGRRLFDQLLVDGYILTCSEMHRASIIQQAIACNPLFRLELALGDVIHELASLRDAEAHCIERQMVVYVQNLSSVSNAVGAGCRAMRDGAVVRYWYALHTPGREHLQKPLLRAVIVQQIYWAVHAPVRGAVRRRMLAYAWRLAGEKRIRLSGLIWVRIGFGYLGMYGVLQGGLRLAKWCGLFRQRRAGHSGNEISFQ